MLLLRILFKSCSKIVTPWTMIISWTCIIDCYASISVRPTENYRQTVLACYDYCWALHNWQSSVSYTCVIHMSSVIHPAFNLRTIAIHMLLWMTQSKRLLQDSHDWEKTINGTDDVTAWSYYEIPDWPIPMLPLLQMLIKKLLQHWAPNSALPSSRIDAGCKVVVILPF
jgi:hypothetical protein